MAALSRASSRSLARSVRHEASTQESSSTSALPKGLAATAAGAKEQWLRREHARSRLSSK